MLLQTTFHYYKIVNIVIKVVSQDIAKQACCASVVCSSGSIFKSWPKIGFW